MGLSKNDSLSFRMSGLAALALAAGLQGLDAAQAVPAIRHPQLDNWIADAMTVWGVNRTVPKSWGVEVIPVRYYHRLDYAVAGSTTNFQFFNVAETPYITNFPGASGLQNNFALMIDSIGIDFEPGVSAAGAFAATPSAYMATTAPLEHAEVARRVFNSGRVIMSIDSRKYVDCGPLKHFSIGAGVELSGVHCNNTAAPTINGAINANNGAPFAGNRGYQFSRPIPLLPGQKPDFTAAFQTAIPVSTASTIRAEMVGYLFRFA